MERRVRRSENPCWELEVGVAWIQREQAFGAAGNVGTETSGRFSPGGLQGRAGAWAVPWPSPHISPAHGAPLLLRSGAHSLMPSCPLGSTRPQLEVAKGLVLSWWARRPLRPRPVRTRLPPPWS